MSTYIHPLDPVYAESVEEETFRETMTAYDTNEELHTIEVSYTVKTISDNMLLITVNEVKKLMSVQYSDLRTDIHHGLQTLWRDVKCFRQLEFENLPI